IITNNTASENDIGIHLYVSSENEVRNNFVNKNSNGIILVLNSNENTITKNNIVNNKNQADIEDVAYNNFDRNYWSDYTGEDKNKDGIGDEPYEIDETNEDRYPYMSYSGWLNVVITPEFWYFFAKKGDAINKTFSIENRLSRAIEVEVVFDENLSFKSDLDGTETNKKTVSILPKSTKNITLRLNTTNLGGYILRTITFKTEDYTKTTLVNGFVQPKLHKVKVEGVDFHRNVVQGQINPFIIILRNYGDKDEFKVNLRMGSEEKSRTVYLNETETKTLTFEIDTSNLPLGINKGEVVVSKDEMVDYLNLTLFVASKLEASTLVVTNLTRFKFKFNESEELRSELIRLTHHPAVNGILLDVTCNYSEFDSDYSKANELCEAIKNQIEQVISEYPNIKYLIIVGDDHIIPFYRIRDGTKDVFTVITGLPDEGDYSLISLPSNSVKKALSTNHFLTDDFYAHLAARRVLAVGRLVEKPDEIIKAIDMFFNYYQLTPTNVFVTGYDFMYDGSEECFEAWRGRIDTTFKYKDKKSSNYANPDEIISEIFNSSISAIFLHANYDAFEVPSGISVKREYLGVEEIRTLNGSIIYTMGCHAGLTIPEVTDLSQTVLSNGTVAYIAPTGYGLGGVITIAGHEKILEYLTKRIASGEEVGFALMNAKNDYYLDNFNQDKLDEKVIRSLTLYGFPMYAVRLGSSSIAALSEDAELELEEHSIKDLAYTVTNTTLEEATLILKPSFTVYETENGTYYSYEGYTTEAGMPILPKATWYFIRGEKEIRGIALRSASFEVNETRLAIETFAVSDGFGSENELKGWYPSIPFTLNTIEDRQGIVTASAQYKYTEWPKKGIIRLFNEIVLDIFRVPVDAEKEKPVVNVDIDKGVVTVEDPAGIYDVLITYQDSGNNSWESKSLGHSESESVEYGIPLNNTVFFVQAIDVNGNVMIDDNNGDYYAC
ncbi:MAG: C25 family cysteine peptidase, partial [Methanophagales archaeon]|nr:C25 family cysteine peptidase [Methanophagales archaeon]